MPADKPLAALNFEVCWLPVATRRSCRVGRMEWPKARPLRHFCMPLLLLLVSIFECILLQRLSNGGRNVLHDA